MCSDFHKRFLNPNDDNISDDEILISEYSYKFQKQWHEKVIDYIKKCPKVLSDDEKKRLGKIYKN